MDRTRLLALAVPTLALALVFSTVVPGSASAAKAPYSPKQLAKIATHIVVGEVQAVYTRTEREGNYEYVRKAAEVRIKTLEKGTGPEGLVYVRYFDRRWKGRGPMPPGGGSYSPQPKAGGTYRFYLARNAYDGWSKNGSQDGGYNVVYVNGVQPIK